MPRGGYRAGAGRKPKASKVVGFRGAVVPAAVVSTAPGDPSVWAPDSAVEVPPVRLKGRALELWQELAGHAVFAQTLVPQTRHAFEVLCRTIARLEEIETSVDGAGLLVAGALGDAPNPLLTQQRGFVQRADALLARFGLAPFGKPVAGMAAGAGPKPINPWAHVAARHG